VALGPLKEEALKEYRERTRKRRELVRRLWRLSDAIGEERVEKLLNRLEKSLKGASA
jgi:hypothetical protein